jgi:hypothetical protein
MTSLAVYDPPMCCSTGVCGPEVDPALARFAGDLDWLKNQGVAVRRFNLSQEPARFVANAAVKALLDRSGGDDLPAIVADDKLVAHGRYPTRQELAAWAGLKAAPAGVARRGLQPLPIVWQRLVTNGQTCTRCGDTGSELEAAMATLALALQPLGIEPVLETQAIDAAAFQSDTAASNRVWIADRKSVV